MVNTKTICIFAEHLKQTIMTTKILITVEGGQIQNIGSNNSDVLIAVVDYDDVNACVGNADFIFTGTEEAFTKPLSRIETKIVQQLTDQEFFK